MARIIVTGANGFIGAEIVKSLAARGDEVVGFDVAVGPALKALSERCGNVTIAAGEITEWHHIANLIRDHRPDAIIHCAAIVGVIASADAPFATVRVNIGGALNVFEAMRLFGVRRVLNLSTEEIYGDFQADRITEDHPCFPLMPYGISKFAVEQLGRDYRRNHGIEAINLRTCWVYGPGLPRARVPKTLVDAAIDGTPLHVAAGGDFRVDHVYIDDVVAGVLAALDKPEHRHDAYHISSGEAPSLYEIVDIINELVPGARLSIGPGHYALNDRIRVVRKGALDTSRARAELGYVPRYNIRNGLAAYIEASRGARRDVGVDNSHRGHSHG
ncbi:MAG TPA: NAD(P)-dependent oxidoreductase [Casimicrobiaceae bacterium]|jgi:UDP-glucose 4-epimerase|nr:NAD(P)-dependent oxidoreductase [Casimicrobiaceae bacterium]